MEIMFDHALETVTWMREKGVKWQLTLNKFFDKKRVAKAAVGGVFNMPPGGALMAMHEGVGLTDDLWAAVEKTDITVFYSAPVLELLTSGDMVRGVRTQQRESFVGLVVTNKMSRYAYPYSITANLEGKHFIGEGGNQFGLTNAKVGVSKSVYLSVLKPS